MNVSFSTAKNLQSEMLQGAVDFTSGAPDTFTALLMRAAYSFSSNSHDYLINVKTNTGAINYDTVASTNTFTRASGSFITDGFTVGNYITTNDATHTGTYKISSVTALVLKVTVVTGAVITDSSQTSKTITSDDEYATADGYTQGGISVTFTETNDLLYLDTINLASSFGAVALAASPGFLIYDNTHASDAIVAFARVSDWRISV